MGEDKQITELDTFTKKYLKEIPSEDISKDFTATLMKKIAQESKKQLEYNKALISKKGWVFIIGFMLSAIVVPLKSTTKSLFKLPEIDFSFLENMQVISELSAISLSNITLYAFLLFGLMVCIQLSFLKKYFDKKYQ